MSDESLINASIEVKELIYSDGKGKHIFSWGVLGQYPLDPQLFHYLRFEMVFKEKLEYIPRLRDQYLPCCSTTCSPTTFYLQLFFSSLSSSLLCSTYTLQIVVVLSQEFQLKDVGQVRLEHIYIVLNWQLIKSNMIN